MIKDNVGLKTYGKNCYSPAETFRLYFTLSVMGKIVQATNQKIQKWRERFESTPELQARLKRMKLSTQNTDCIELQAVLAVLYFMGLLLPRGWNKKRIWGEAGHQFIKATIGRERFSFIWRNLRFDDSSTTQERAKKDRFTKIREVFEDLNRNFSRVMFPDIYLGNIKSLSNT